MDQNDFDYLKLLPEANPIIINPIKDELIDDTIYSLYKFQKSFQSIHTSLDDHNFDLQKENKHESQLLKSETLEDVFSDDKLLYGKYSGMQSNNLTVCLKIGSEFNQIICNLQKLQQIRKRPSTPIDDKFRETMLDKENLTFDSDFESGNLSQVIKSDEREYQLLLQNDINSKGHTQWFYFRVRNGLNLGSYKFSILNLSKHGYLYDCGMKIAIKSKLNPNQGWFRGGSDIMYQKNGLLKYKEDEQNSEWYTLTFSYDFQQADDEIYFAHSNPYTVTDLNTYLNNLDQDQEIRRYYNRSLLCKSLLGNRLEKITITDQSCLESDKRAIVIMGRVHPGETVSSFIVQGFIDWLLSNDIQAQSIRKNYIVKIIPLLNPDGVIHGNYRCSLSGSDLNRRWQYPTKELHPEIFHAKNMIMQLNKMNKISLLIDCHGHNTKRSIFMYGCNTQQRQKVNQRDQVSQNLKNMASKQFAYLLSQIDKNFSYKNSSFMIQKEKYSTARVTLWNDLKIPQVYTLESSFCGAEQNQYHFSNKDLLQMGMSVGICIYQYFYDKNTGQLIQQLDEVKKLRKKSKKNSKIQSQRIKGYLNDFPSINKVSQGKLGMEGFQFNQQLLQQTLEDENGNDSAGSNSQPSGDNLSFESLKHILPKLIKKKLPQKKQEEKVEKLIIELKKITQTPIYVKQPIAKIVSHSVNNNRYQTKQEFKESKYVEVLPKIFDISWLLPSNYQIQQENKQQKLLKQILEQQSRVGFLVISLFVREIKGINKFRNLVRVESQGFCQGMPIMKSLKKFFNLYSKLKDCSNKVSAQSRKSFKSQIKVLQLINKFSTKGI